MFTNPEGWQRASLTSQGELGTAATRKTKHTGTDSANSLKVLEKMQAVGVSQELEFICIGGLSYQKAFLETVYLLKKCNEYFSAFRRPPGGPQGSSMYKGARGRGGREVSGDMGNELLPP